MCCSALGPSVETSFACGPGREISSRDVVECDVSGACRPVFREPRVLFLKDSDGAGLACDRRDQPGLGAGVSPVAPV